MRFEKPNRFSCKFPCNIFFLQMFLFIIYYFNALNGYGLIILFRAFIRPNYDKSFILIHIYYFFLFQRFIYSMNGYFQFHSPYHSISRSIKLSSKLENLILLNTWTKCYYKKCLVYAYI